MKESSEQRTETANKGNGRIPQPGQLWTVPQVAFKLQLSQSTIIRMITSGVIPALCVRAGKRKKTFRVRQEVLEKWFLSTERRQARDQKSTKPEE